MMITMKGSTIMILIQVIHDIVMANKEVRHVITQQH